MKRAAPALLALAVTAAYSGTFSTPFVLDDAANIAGKAGAGLTVAGRPVFRLSLVLNQALSGSEVWSYHALNLAIHVAAALVLFGIVRRTALVAAPNLSADFLALLAAGLWALHPLQTESVTYISQRAESLMGLFYLLTLYCFIRGSAVAGVGDPGSRPKRGRLQWFWFGLSWLACLFGMATKEVMVTAPILVLFYDGVFVSGGIRAALHRHARAYIGLIAGWGVLALLELHLHGRGQTAGFDTGLPWHAYALTQVRAVVLYLGLFLWPHPLVFDYGQPVSTALGSVLPQLLLLLALLGATLAALLREAWRPLGFLGMAFFLILAPSSSVIPIATQTITEHRMYLPLAPLAVLTAWALLTALGRPGFALGFGLAAGLAVLTYSRNSMYRSALGLWADTVAKCPSNPRAHYNLGVELAKSPGRRPDAVEEYQRAVDIMPDYLEAQYNLAAELSKFPGRQSESIAHYTAALRVDPDFAEAHYNLALELANMSGREEEAVSHYEAAIRLKPDFVEAHVNLAFLYAREGRREETRRELEAAFRLRPDWPGVRKALAQLPP